VVNAPAVARIDSLVNVVALPAGREVRSERNAMTTPLDKPLYTPRQQSPVAVPGMVGPRTAYSTLICAHQSRLADPAARPTPRSSSRRVRRLFPERNGSGGSPDGGRHEQLRVTSRVTIGTIAGEPYGLAVELDVNLPDVDEETAEKVVPGGATRSVPTATPPCGNIEVTLKVYEHRRSVPKFFGSR